MSARQNIILGVSLIANVFLVGIGLGVVLTGAKITPVQAAKHPVPNIWAASEALPQPQKAAFRKMLIEKAAAMQPELKSVRLARREAVALMSQPNYDPVAVNQALQRAREGEGHARSEIDAAFSDYLSHMTLQERTALAAAMVKNRPNALRRAIATQGQDGGAVQDQ